MTDLQFHQLLKQSFSEYFLKDQNGKCRSTVEAMELIEVFKKQVQNEAVKEFIKTYRSLVPDKEKRRITNDILSRRNENLKNPLVKCK